MLYPVKATYDIMALISSFGIAYRLAEKYRTLDPLSWSDVAGGLHDDDPAEHAVYAGTRRGGGD